MIDVNIDTYFIKTNTKTISITSSTYFKSMVLSLLRQVISTQIFCRLSSTNFT